jgi:hypothetical protein
MAWRGPTVKPIANQPPHNPINHGPEMSDSKKPVTEAVFGPNAVANRAYNVRRDNDEQKDFSVTLLDVDTTIVSYLDTVISPTIVDAGRQVKVPINYASPERWKAIRKDGAIRDKNGKIQCPAIALRRTTMQRNDNLATLNRYLQHPVIKQFSEKNKYDKFSVMSGFSPVKEIYSVAMPDHVIVNYDFIIWTDLIEQGNSIVEAINFSTEDYWGDRVRFKFRTTISDYNFETSTDADQDRIVKTTFNMMVYAYLLPNRYENYRATVQKAFSQRKVVFGVTESTIDISKMDAAQLVDAAKDLAAVSVQTFSPDVSGAGSKNPSYVNSTNYAINAGQANIANSSTSASYVDTLKLGGSFQEINIVGGGVTGSFGTNIVYNVSSFTPVDSLPQSSGNAAKWLISINDGGANFKTSELVASWNNTTASFYNTEVSQIGYVPVMISANNVYPNINVMAVPLSGTWTVKLIRMMV